MADFYDPDEDLTTDELVIAWEEGAPVELAVESGLRAWSQGSTSSSPGAVHVYGPAANASGAVVTEVA